MSALPLPGTLSPLRSALRRLSAYVARNRALYATWLVTTLGYVALLTGFPILVGRTIDLVAGGAAARAVLPWVALLIGVAVVGATLRFFTRVLVFNAAREIEYEMRNDLFAHLARLPQSFYARWRTGDIMSRCVNDLTAVRTLLGFGLLQVVQTPIFYVAVLGTMFALNARLALLVLLPYPLFIVIARTLGRAIYRWSLAVQEGLAELSNQLQETVSGISVVKAYAMETVTADRFERANQGLYGHQLQLVRSNAALSSLVLMLPAAAMWIILWLGGREILADRMNVGEFFTFAMFVYELTFPTLLMGWVVALTQRGAAAMQRIDELLSIEPEIADRGEAVRVPPVRGDIEFRGLEFRYPDAVEPALTGIDLRIPAGTTLGVVGPVGSGKTTLVSLIPRIHPVADGQLFVDGIDVNRIPLRTLRSAIAMVPQESFLFSMSLAENIAFGVPQAGPADIAEAARRAQLVKDVEDLPDGYDTVVGERGVMLSGGQRQRAALARALMLQPSILILDDTLSAVDAETEAAIRRELREVFRDRTVVVISSRVSAVRDADQIVVLDAGHIVERGSHEWLMANAGLYSRLAREQARERDLTRALEAAGGAP